MRMFFYFDMGSEFGLSPEMMPSRLPLIGTALRPAGEPLPDYGSGFRLTQAGGVVLRNAAGEFRVPLGWAVRSIPAIPALWICAMSALAGAPTATVPEIESAFDARVIILPTFSEDSGSKPHEIAWTYVNRWDFPLVVERFEESCACLRGRSDGQPVGPGGTGMIRADFETGSHRGLVRKSLRVRFVGHERPVELVAETRVPASVELSDHELVWHAGATDAARTVEVTAGTSTSFKINDVRGVESEEFGILIETVVEGRHYRITITPGAGLPDSATRCLRIRTDSPDPRDRVLAVFLRTGEPPAAEAPVGAGPTPEDSPAPAPGSRA